MLLGAGSPLVLLSLLGGAHNDALMVGLLMAGLAVAKRVGTVPGVILCALAAGVKSPAALGVLFLGLGLGRTRVHPCAAASAHTALAGAHRAGHHGGGLAHLRHRLGLDPHDHARRTPSFTGVTPVNVVARAVSIVSHLVQVADLDHAACARCSACWDSLIAVYVGLASAPAFAPGGSVKTLGITLLGAGPPRSDRLGLVRDLGHRRPRPGGQGPHDRRCLIVISTFWAFAGMTSVHGIFSGCCTPSS